MSKQRTVLVVGGGRGIGEAIVRRFAAAGEKLAVADFDEGNARTVAATIGASAHGVDIRDERSVVALFDEVAQRHGQVDILVNTAGVFLFGTSLRDMTLSQWQSVIDVNLTGTFLCTREAARRMTPHVGASIINFSSGSGVRANEFAVAYGASKAGVAHFTRNAAIDLAAQGIRVNAISPGATLTPMLQSAHNEARQSSIASGIPLGRLLVPSDIAGAAFFLASDEAGFITGEVINVDGGTAIAGRLSRTARSEPQQTGD